MGSRYRDIMAALGPGICMAGAAIGVSHLMQATRAGATFGWSLLFLVILVNVFKYPFFEYGHRYTAATGETLLDGYRRLGRVTLITFLVLNIVTAIGAITGVTLLTAALASYFLGDFISLFSWAALILGICAALIVLGHFRALDRVIKVVVGFLFLATLVAFIAAAIHGPVGEPGFIGPDPWTLASLGFLIALMGWMPAPIEVSALQSLWMKAKDRDYNRDRTPLRDALVDFNIGYGLMIITAVLFLGLGAMVMYGTGVQFAADNVGFTRQLVSLYTQHLGNWAGPVIGLAAFTTMFSTTLTVLDGYPRSLAHGFAILLRGEGAHAPRDEHFLWIGFGGSAAVAILFVVTVFEVSVTGLIDVVTVIAFLAAPFFAFWNHRLIFSRHLPAEARPGLWLRMGSSFGIVFLAGFSLFYIVQRFVLA